MNKERILVLTEDTHLGRKTIETIFSDRKEVDFVIVTEQMDIDKLLASIQEKVMKYNTKKRSPFSKDVDCFDFIFLVFDTDRFFEAHYGDDESHQAKVLVNKIKQFQRDFEDYAGFATPIYCIPSFPSIEYYLGLYYYDNHIYFEQKIKDFNCCQCPVGRIARQQKMTSKCLLHIVCETKKDKQANLSKRSFRKEYLKDEIKRASVDGFCVSVTKSILNLEILENLVMTSELLDLIFSEKARTYYSTHGILNEYFFCYNK